MVDKYSVADERERNRIRGKLDGLQRLQRRASCRRADSPGKAKVESASSPGTGEYSTPVATSPTLEKLSSESSNDSYTPQDLEEGRAETEKNKALWGSTLPPATNTIHSGHITPGYNYEYINHGPSSKRTPEDFRKKPKKSFFNLPPPFR